MTIVATHVLSLELVLEAPSVAALDTARAQLRDHVLGVVPFAPITVATGRAAGKQVRVIRATASYPGGKPREVRPSTPRGGGE